MRVNTGTFYIPKHNRLCVCVRGVCILQIELSFFMENKGERRCGRFAVCVWHKLSVVKVCGWIASLRKKDDSKQIWKPLFSGNLKFEQGDELSPANQSIRDKVVCVFRFW